MIKDITDTTKKLKEIIPDITSKQITAIHNIIIDVDGDGYDRGYDTGLKVGKESSSCEGCNKGTKVAYE